MKREIPYRDVPPRHQYVHHLSESTFRFFHFDCDTLAIRGRAEELIKMRFGVADAAHIAFAEATAEVFISCDDVLVGRCRRKGIRVQAVNPLEFVLQEGLR